MENPRYGTFRYHPALVRRLKPKIRVPKTEGKVMEFGKLGAILYWLAAPVAGKGPPRWFVCAAILGVLFGILHTVGS